MTREEFKKKREAGEEFEARDFANLAKEWWLFSRPYCCRMEFVIYSVLREAKVENYEEWKPTDED